MTPRITSNKRQSVVYPVSAALQGLPNLGGGSRPFGAQYDGTLVSACRPGFSLRWNVNTTPSLSSSAALQVAFGAAGLQDLKGRVKTDLVIVPVELEASYTYGLAWEVSVYDYDRNPPFSKTFLIDAHSGKVLEEYGHGAGVMDTAVDSPAFTLAGRTVPAHSQEHLSRAALRSWKTQPGL